MRPLGTYGEVGFALLDAAREAPGTVRQLAERAQVGYAAARYTASRMVTRGRLDVVSEGRPVVLGIASVGDMPAGEETDATRQLADVLRSFWEV